MGPAVRSKSTFLSLSLFLADVLSHAVRSKPWMSHPLRSCLQCSLLAEAVRES